MEYREKGYDAKKRYTIGKLARLLGISRTTLLYYESHNVSDANRGNDSNYRIFRNKDILNLMNSLMLRNVGLSVSEISDIRKEGHPLSDENIQRYEDRLDHRIEYLKAIRESLEDCRMRRTRSDDVFAIVESPVYYYVLTNVESGWDKYQRTEIADILLANMPITGTGSVFDGSFLEENHALHWGRFAPERYIHLLDISPDDMYRIGGSLCLRIRITCDDTLVIDSDHKLRRKAKIFLKDSGYEAKGNAFCPHTFPVGDSTIEYVYQPIQPIE